MQWDPANPLYYDTLGTLIHLYADAPNPKDVVELYEKATLLGPNDAQFWSDLGAGYDWAGRGAEALDALLRARRLFPNSPDINWRLANFYIRAGKIADGFDALRTVLRTDPTARRKAFELAANASRDKAAILGLFPPEAGAFFDYINFQTERGDIPGAEATWARILQLNLPFDVAQAFSYFDALIQHQQVDAMGEAWSALAARFPARLQPLAVGSNLIHNGSFEHEILNGGLDWRIIPMAGAVASVTSMDPGEGGRALQIAFDGSRNLDYGHVFQFVPVQANTRYRFSAHISVKGITTDSGPRFQISDAYNAASLLMSTENLVGTSGWQEQHAEFMTRSGTRLLLVKIARPASDKLDNQISGTVRVSRISLEAVL